LGSASDAAARTSSHAATTASGGAASSGGTAGDGSGSRSASVRPQIARANSSDAHSATGVRCGGNSGGNSVRHSCRTCASACWSTDSVGDCHAANARASERAPAASAPVTTSVVPSKPHSSRARSPARGERGQSCAAGAATTHGCRASKRAPMGGANAIAAQAPIKPPSSKPDITERARMRIRAVVSLAASVSRIEPSPHAAESGSPESRGPHGP